jgi:hypothetical protein
MATTCRSGRFHSLVLGYLESVLTTNFADATATWSARTANDTAEMTATVEMTAVAKDATATWSWACALGSHQQLKGWPGQRQGECKTPCNASSGGVEKDEASTHKQHQRGGLAVASPCLLFDALGCFWEVFVSGSRRRLTWLELATGSTHVRRVLTGGETGWSRETGGRRRLDESRRVEGESLKDPSP